MNHLKHLVTVDIPKDAVIGFNTHEPLQPISLNSIDESKTHYTFPYSCEVRTYWNESDGVTEVSSNFPIEIYKELDTEVLLRIILP